MYTKTNIDFHTSFQYGGNLVETFGRQKYLI